jgi:hypothetical protein
MWHCALSTTLIKRGLIEFTTLAAPAAVGAIGRGGWLDIEEKERE